MISPAAFHRPTWVEIDLSNLAFNYRLIRRKISRTTKMLVAVKANAYGHGLVEVSRVLLRCGVDYLGVACVDEALMLRRHGVKADILHLGAFLKPDVEAILHNRITATVADLSTALALSRAAARRKIRARVHVKVDTGMGRIGVWHSEAEDFVRRVCALPGLFLEGIYTHFPCADSDESFTSSQLAAFCGVVDRLKLRGIDIPLKHAANSVAVIGCEQSHLNLVRPGLAMYGLHPTDESLGELGIRPVLSFKSRIVFLKDVARGRSISYSRTFVAPRAMKVATLPVGYGDGYNRLLSNKGHVLVGGRRCPVVGRVCMDQVMVDVTRVSHVKLADPVVLIGRQQSQQILVEEVAKLCKTIPYEVVCWISPRVARVYRGM